MAFKLTDEQIRKEVEDINNDQKWGDERVFIHMKNIYTDPMEFGFLKRHDRKSIHVITLLDMQVTEKREFASTSDLVSKGWVVD